MTPHILPPLHTFAFLHCLITHLLSRPVHSSHCCIFIACTHLHLFCPCIPHHHHHVHGYTFYTFCFGLVFFPHLGHLFLTLSSVSRGHLQPCSALPVTLYYLCLHFVFDIVAGCGAQVDLITLATCIALPRPATFTKRCPLTGRRPALFLVAGRLVWSSLALPLCVVVITALPRYATLLVPPLPFGWFPSLRLLRYNRHPYAVPHYLPVTVRLNRFPAFANRRYFTTLLRYHLLDFPRTRLPPLVSWLIHCALAPQLFALPVSTANTVHRFLSYSGFAFLQLPQLIFQTLYQTEQGFSTTPRFDISFLLPPTPLCQFYTTPTLHTLQSASSDYS